MPSPQSFMKSAGIQSPMTIAQTSASTQLKTSAMLFNLLESDLSEAQHLVKKAEGKEDDEEEEEEEGEEKEEKVEKKEDDEEEEKEDTSKEQAKEKVGELKATLQKLKDQVMKEAGEDKKKKDKINTEKAQKISKWVK